VTTIQLLQQVHSVLLKWKFAIILSGIISAVIFFLLAFSSKPVYTSRSSVFPLTNQQENSLTNSSLTALLGLAENSKSFSSEAAIDIVELALSRNLRESVASSRLQQFGNKMIAQILLEDRNNNLRFYSRKEKIPADSTSLVIKGGEMLKSDFDAKVNKNGVLELYFSSPNAGLVMPVSEMIISKISEFYINLRTQKATADYSFIAKKVDSLENIISSFDKKAVQLQNSTFFTKDNLEYSLPKDNLAIEKERLIKQREAGINNRDEALWRLQKVTPIIATLDKPAPPFQVEKKSPILWTLIGAVIGVLLTTLFVLRNIIFTYMKSELITAIS
jgi:uncharacterized protein involved in exopolysaccharide biosynthesis